MRLHSLVPGALVLCAITATGFAQASHTPKALHPQTLGAADPSASTHFTVYLPLTNQSALDTLVREQADSTSPQYHQWLTPAQFKAKFGPSASDMAKVTRKLEAAGFTVTAQHTQSLEVTGPVWAVENLFVTRLNQVQTPHAHIRLSAASHQLTLPAELAAAGAVIPGFYPQLSAHVHSVKVAASAQTSGISVTHGALPNQRLSTGEYWYYPDDMNEAYQLPSFQTEASQPLTLLSLLFPSSRKQKQIAGVGTHIGIVIDSAISPADLAASFNSEVSAGPYIDIQDYSAVSNLPVPTVTLRLVDGGSGPFDPSSDDAAEASLDTQVSLGTAPGAQETIYNIPDLEDSSIADAYAAIDEDNAVDVVSSSFGECELYFTAAYNGGVDFTGIARTYHSLFQQGNAQGITFLASSGDNGAVPCLSAAFANNPTDGTSFVKGVENPASDPNVTAVGGTNLVTVPVPTVNDAKYSAENADYDPRVPAEYELAPGDIVSVNNNTWGSGGGYSVIFSKPAYQLLVDTGNQKGRAVPDVSLQMGGCPSDADIDAGACDGPRSATIVWLGGGPALLIGTSSSSPQMAGVVALGVELAGTRLGNINPLIYALSTEQTLFGILAPQSLQYFHRQIEGNNNGYTVKPGQAYSTVLGNSTLDVKNFLQLQSAAPAGTPGTPSNP